MTRRQDWTAPTPASTRREDTARAAQRAADDARCLAQATRPTPVLVRSRTPEHEAELSRRRVELAAPVTVPPPLRTVEEQVAWKARNRLDRGAQHAADRMGEPCGCGVTRDAVCLIHAALIGHRRHIRPAGAKQTNDKGRRDVRRLRLYDPEDFEAA